MKVITLHEFGEDRFLKELKTFSEQNFSGDNRNRDWFLRIPQIYKTRFKEWFFLVNNNELIAFATIQEFYSGCYRLLTRTYYNPAYRRTHLAYEHNKKTPAMYLLDKQIEYLTDYKILFISMQDINRRKVLTKVMNKIGGRWKLHPNMVQTCQEVADKNCWQNIIFTGESINLPNITINEWKKMKGTI